MLPPQRRAQRRWVASLCTGGEAVLYMMVIAKCADTHGNQASFERATPHMLLLLLTAPVMRK